MLYGLMTEEINHSYDGGLYAELIQNRAFKDDAEAARRTGPVVKAPAPTARIALDTHDPVNTTALTTSLRLDIVSRRQAASAAAVANDGYWGIPVRPNTNYRASFYAKAAAGFSGPLTVDYRKQRRRHRLRLGQRAGHRRGSGSSTR